jgi:hypothetical protein
MNGWSVDLRISASLMAYFIPLLAARALFCKAFRAKISPVLFSLAENTFPNEPDPIYLRS